MWITILMGGTYMMENPMNSLVACHPRYVWMVEKLQEIGVMVAHLGPCAKVFPDFHSKTKKGALFKARFEKSSGGLTFEIE